MESNETIKTCSGDCTELIYSCHHNTMEYYGYLFVYTPIAITGIIFNIFNLCILAKTTFKGCAQTFTFLIAMAVADLGYLCICCPIGIIRCAPSNGKEWQFYSRQIYEIYIYTPIVNMFATASIWITTTVAIERYITVAHIALGQNICTVKNAKRAIAGIYITSVIFLMPYFFYREVNHEYNGDDQDKKIFTDFSQSLVFSIWSWMRIIFVKYIPVGTVIIFNLLLLMSVCKTNHKRMNLVAPQSGGNINRRQQQQNKCTAMLLGITITFVLCHILEPFIHSVIYTTLFGCCSVFAMTYRNLVMSVNTLETISFASNFIFYCVFNKEFAAGVKKMLKCEKTCGNKGVNTVIVVKPIDTKKYGNKLFNQMQTNY